MIDKDGMAPWEICALCHGANGISAMAKFPVLAGQKQSYLERQFEHFRQGVRTNDGGQMQGITSEVEPSSISAITAYFANLTPPKAKPLNAEVGDAETKILAHGKKLFFEGNDNVLACASCHADSKSNAPWIDGQHRAYLQKQLQDFATGKRTSEDGIMTKIATNMTANDIAASALFASAIRLNRQ